MTDIPDFDRVYESGPDGAPPHGTRALVQLTANRNAQIHHLPRPVSPQRKEPIYDDDGCIVDWHSFTRVEHGQRMERYRKQVEEWNRTGGAYVEHAPLTFEATISEPDGSRYEYVGNGKSWRLIRTELPRVEQEALGAQRR